MHKEAAIGVTVWIQNLNVDKKKARAEAIMRKVGGGA